MSKLQASTEICHILSDAKTWHQSLWMGRKLLQVCSRCAVTTGLVLEDLVGGGQKDRNNIEAVGR